MAFPVRAERSPWSPPAPEGSLLPRSGDEAARARAPGVNGAAGADWLP
jgi:hypothetical protein